ncbi:hypothetical protein SLEP1_g38928 [Rubroshorea leprosula]|uniref:Uncharacterized protein n=1 Tax=Rubroshorea leprosula TaxID=152421 RepID=A0AAV5KZ05_9ROSI|nr:hypothetical protein SLEP1_g38928 [Rubroshorea leprosula]
MKTAFVFAIATTSSYFEGLDHKTLTPTPSHNNCNGGDPWRAEPIPSLVVFEAVDGGEFAYGHASGNSDPSVLLALVELQTWVIKFFIFYFPLGADDGGWLWSESRDIDVDDIKLFGFHAWKVKDTLGQRAEFPSTGHWISTINGSSGGRYAEAVGKK